MAAVVSSSRIVIVSNRLPVTVRHDAGNPTLTLSVGGLATGLRAQHDASGGVWIGWPGSGDEITAAERASLEEQLAAMRIVPVWLSDSEVRRFYDGVSNGVLWPLFHYRLDQLPLHVRDWDAYEAVNARFAEAVVAQHRPGDVVWVHDYQLMRLPHLIRQRLPEARIGFFLHIPFPSSEVFRTLPFRQQVLEGLLGADLIGFHTPAYMRHFASTLLRTLGVPVEVDRVRFGDRELALGVFPLGVDTEAFAALACDPGVAAEAASFRTDADSALLVGIDRLDYTKGIPRRLLAFEKLLLDHPPLREHVRLVQVAVPSRPDVDAYQEFRHQVDALIGRVNGAFGTPRWVPVHYIHRGLTPAEVVALYRAADVMLVTPVRDGMNLVAKEFVAARTDEDGVLVLSEFAGAASELAEALLVNPYDVDEAAAVYHRALTMPLVERRTRMQGLRRRVLNSDVHRWAISFLEMVEAVSARRRAPVLPTTPPDRVQAVLGRMRASPRLLLLLDYDGTLVPFAGVPELAVPDAELLELLRRLAVRPGTSVHVVSGRPRETMERWLGVLPIGLHAEHGFWSRDTPDGSWESLPRPTTDWCALVRPILEDFSARTPGALVEDKSVSLAWHYRMADPEFGVLQANELRVHLHELLSNAPVEILPGEKVIEVRPYGVTKASVVRRLGSAAPDVTLAAFGDDRTDEELFAALPAGALSFHVGPLPSRAEIRLGNVADARRLLSSLSRE
jgi:trehalose 6-phosphate synthase/phosphatase